MKSLVAAIKIGLHGKRKAGRPVEKMMQKRPTMPKPQVASRKTATNRRSYLER